MYANADAMVPANTRFSDYAGLCSSRFLAGSRACGNRRMSLPCMGSRVHVCCGIAEPSGEPLPFGQKTRYNDSFLDKAFMRLVGGKMGTVTGTHVKINGYEDFVELSRQVMKRWTPAQQQENVHRVLLSMLPPGASEMFRKLFPPTRRSAEINAAITVLFFQWLVGPSQVVEVEVDGVKQKSGVHIKKCRYLENSGCVGMCVNMCKLPTQNFFRNEFGLPLTMNPNFEDMSCEMIYGQHPLPLEDDPALNQPCFTTMCPTAQSKNVACPNLHA